MPCDGIYPGAPGMEHDDPRLQKFDCWVCSKQGCHHFVGEWDSAIHARCAITWLADKDNIEAQIIVRHNHQVMLDFSLEAK